MTSRLTTALRGARRAVGKRLYASQRWRNRLVIRIINRSGLFDSAWVRTQLADPNAVVTVGEYVANEWYRAGISPNPLLEPACVPISADTNEPITAYLTSQLRHIHPLFDERLYLNRNPDGDRHAGRAVGHFLAFHRHDPLPNMWPRHGTYDELIAEPSAFPRADDSSASVSTSDVDVDLTIVVIDGGPPAALIWSATSLARLPARIDGRSWRALLVAEDASERRVLTALCRAADHLSVIDPQRVPTPIGGLGVVLACRGTTFEYSQLAVLAADLRDGQADAFAPVALGWDHYLLDHGSSKIDTRHAPNQAGRPAIDQLPASTPVDRPGEYVVGFTPAAFHQASTGASSIRDVWRNCAERARTTQTSAAQFTQHETNLPAFASATAASDSTVVQPTRARDQLRFSVRIAAPSGEIGDQWGDVAFADDLVEAITRAGHLGFVERADQRGRAGSAEDDVTVTIRGLEQIAPVATSVNVLWIISHPTLVSAEELAAYDVVFAASQVWAAEMSARTGTAIQPLLQATNPRRFSCDVALSRDDSAVFVGNSRDVLRPIVADAIEAGVNLRVYGHGWRGLIPRSYVAATHLPPEEVGPLYQRAGVVLNDQWTDMANSGFVVNRLFDALATGAPVISTPAIGVRELFGDRVHFSQNARDFSAAMAAIAHESIGDRLESAQWIAENHTFDDRFAKILAAVRNLPGQRPSSY